MSDRMRNPWLSEPRRGSAGISAPEVLSAQAPIAGVTGETPVQEAIDNGNNRATALTGEIKVIASAPSIEHPSGRVAGRWGN